MAPCLSGGFPALTLKDDKGGIAAVFVGESFDVRALPVGPPDQAPEVTETAQFRLPPAPIFKPGTFTAYVSIGTRTGTPVITLPLRDGDGHRRYRLGTISIR